MARYLVVAIALWAGVGATYGGRVDFPSPTWSVRACPAGAAAPRKLWNGISPQVKEWELGGRAETLRKVMGPSSAPFTNTGNRIEISCRLPTDADAAHPAPVFLSGPSEDMPTNALTARGYAVVGWSAGNTGDETVGARVWGHERALDWIAARPELDATRVAVVGKAALEVGARDERFAMAVVEGSDCGDVRDLLRLMAPRLVYGVNGEATTWNAARDLYRAYGLEERMGGYRSEGACGLRADDWERVMDFADRHLKAPSMADSDEIDRRLAAACAPGGSRTLVLARNPAASDGVWRLTRAIRVPSDFTLVFDGCRVELVDGTQDNIVRNAGAAEGACRPDRNLRILGRNGAVLSGGRRNHYRPRRSGDPNGWRSVGILLCDVGDYEIGGLRFEETQCWAISQERCFRGRVHDLVFGSTDLLFNQDGVDVRKGCHDLVIENISGVTGDDAVALTAYRDPPGSPARYGMQIGGNADLGARDDVYNVTIRNVRARSAGGHGVIRLLTCDGIKMHHITVENVVDTATEGGKRPQATIRIGDRAFHKTRRCEMGEMHHVAVRNVTASGPIAVWIKGPLCDSEVVGVVAAPGGRKYDVTAPLRNVRLDPEGDK